MHQRLRQQDVADRAGVSHSTVSLLENGPLDGISVEVLQRVADVLDVRIEVTASYRGPLGERLLNRRHSQLADSVISAIRRHQGWHAEAEVSYSIYGERGIIDQLAWHLANRHLLVIELKTEFVDFNALLGTLDRNVRLARRIAAERGWDPKMISVWLIVSDTKTNRRSAKAHASLLASRFALDGRSLSAFLDHPAAPTTGLAFWSVAAHSDGGQKRDATWTRIRRPESNEEPIPRGGRPQLGDSAAIRDPGISPVAQIGAVLPDVGVTDL